MLCCRRQSVLDRPGLSSAAIRYTQSQPGYSWKYSNTDAAISSGGGPAAIRSIAGGALSWLISGADVYSTWADSGVGPYNLLLFGLAPTNYNPSNSGYQVYLNDIPTVVSSCPGDNLTTYATQYQIHCNQTLFGSDLVTATGSTGNADGIEQCRSVADCAVITSVPSCELSCYFKPGTARTFTTLSFEYNSAFIIKTASKFKAHQEINAQQQMID